MNNQPMPKIHRSRYLLPNVLTLVIAALFLLTYQSWASAANSTTQQPSQSPSQTISYQGTLTNELGQPINEALPMTFRLYADPAAGEALWTEVYTGTNSLVVQNGQFQVLLGSQTPFPPDLWKNSALYLGIQIDTDAEMSPREKLSAAPYAMQSNSSLTITDRSIDSAKLALQQQVQPIQSPQPITVTTTVSASIGAEIPGTELVLELDKVSRILYTAQFIATYSNPEATQTIQVVANGVAVHRYQTTGQLLDTVGIFRYIDLPAGTHRITLNYQASIADSQLQLQGDPGSDFVSYLVVDQPE